MGIYQWRALGLTLVIMSGSVSSVRGMKPLAEFMEAIPPSYTSQLLPGDREQENLAVKEQNLDIPEEKNVSRISARLKKDWRLCGLQMSPKRFVSYLVLAGAIIFVSAVVLHYTNLCRPVACGVYPNWYWRKKSNLKMPL